MEQLIELLKQIQELAGVAVDALEGASKGDGGQGGGDMAAAGEGAMPPGGDAPPQQ